VINDDGKGSALPFLLSLFTFHFSRFYFLLFTFHFSRLPGGLSLMLWIIFALGAALAWGLYGPALHRGQVALGNPMRALLCVGVAYFLIGVLVPVANLSYSGQLHGFSWKGGSAATLGGAKCEDYPEH
jgi:hypothetical protein